jgi:hypothetical protein
MSATLAVASALLRKTGPLGIDHRQLGFPLLRFSGPELASRMYDSIILLT